MTGHTGADTTNDPLANATVACSSHTSPDSKRQLPLTLAALGVVYGDIGTSPLYALKETALEASAHVPLPSAIFGVVSLIVWSLIIVVTIKYVGIIMRADNGGEGGIIALATLAHQARGIGARTKLAISMAALFGIALFFGDGMLTPAISVLSAVEGLTVTSPALQPLVLPLVLAILAGVFAIQSFGTAKVGRLFGPVMVIWFAALMICGAVSVWRTPAILAAISPHYALMLFAEEPWAAFVSLGAVVLAVTGCEALYADMGHFGKAPIRRAWLFIVFPALLLTYFGQGAAILRQPELAHTAFYAVVPHFAYIPMLLLSTAATVIASQAVISGVYSATQQIVQLGMLPRMEIRHTSATDYGQIYVPRINAYLCVGVILIVLIFKSSDALAAAYGIAVTGVMGFSTILGALVAWRVWNKPLRLVLPVFLLLILIDIAFFVSNALKIADGGWLPLLIGVFVFSVMETWRKGRRIHLDHMRDASMPLEHLLARIDHHPVRVSGTAVFLSARTDAVPGALLHNLKHNKVLHERIILATVKVSQVPFVTKKNRLTVENAGKGFFTVCIHYGFFETPDIPRALTGARGHGLAIEPESTTYFIGRETLVPSAHPRLGRWRTRLYMSLAANALSPARYYRLPPGRVVELGTEITI